jgi:phosphate transport system permease protein
MVCGNIVRFPTDLFGPTRTLTANIALEMAYATGAHRAALYASGFALFLLVALITFIAFRCSPTE